MKDLVHQFDLNATRSIQSVPASVGTMLTFVTYAGLPIVTFVIATTLAVAFYSGGQIHAVVAYAASVVALGCNTILKLTLQRRRPDTAYVSRMRFKSYSFPSGHAFGSLMVYGLLAYLALHHLAFPWGLLGLGLLGVGVLAIGISRIYLGAHFPTDVVGAWLLGAVFLVAVIALVRP